MPQLGDILTTTDVPSRAQRSGTVAVTALELTKAVTFATAMPSANYRVFLQPEANLAATLWATAKTTTGFQLNLSVGVAGSLSWLVVED